MMAISCKGQPHLVVERDELSVDGPMPLLVLYVFTVNTDGGSEQAHLVVDLYKILFYF